MISIGGDMGRGQHVGEHLDVLENWRTLDQGYYSSIKEAQNRVFRTEEEWQKFATQFSSSRGEVLQAVDFTKDVVIFVHAGERNTGGYSIEITSIMVTNQRNKWIVHYEISCPGPREGTTQALTQPYHLVMVPLPTDMLRAANQQNDFIVEFDGKEVVRESTSRTIMVVFEDSQDPEECLRRIEAMADMVESTRLLMDSIGIIEIKDSFDLGEAEDVLGTVEGVDSVERD